MIELDIEEDNSEILEYVLKVAYKFYPMVYEDSKGIMHVGGTKADEEFEYYYNKGEVNFLSYNEYLNDGKHPIKYTLQIHKTTNSSYQRI